MTSRYKVLMIMFSMALLTSLRGWPQSVRPTIGANFTATTYKFNGGYPPPDTMGAIGPNHFVEFINTRYAVYDEATGNLVQESTPEEFWQASWAKSVPEAQLANPYVWASNGSATYSFPTAAAVNPRILYDAASGRWYAIANDGVELLFAVSNTSDPTMGWKGYQFDGHVNKKLFDMSSDKVTVADMNRADDAAVMAVQNEFTGNNLGPNGSDECNRQKQKFNIRFIQKDRRWVVQRWWQCGSGAWLVRPEDDHLGVYWYPQYDFPTLGIDADNLYVTTSLEDSPLFVIPQKSLREGTPPVLPAADPTTHTPGVTVIQYGPNSHFAQPVVDLDHNTNRALLVKDDFDQLTFQRIQGTSLVNAGTAGYSYHYNPPVATQPGQKRSGAGTHELETGTTLTSNVVLKNGEIHGVRCVYDGGLARLWYFRVKVEYTGAPPNDTFIFTTLDDVEIRNPPSSPNLNAFYGSVAVNDKRQVVIGFTGSDADQQYASSYAAVGQLDSSGQHILVSDPLLLKAGHAEYEVSRDDYAPTRPTGRNGWGDYSATTVDPSDPSHFWTIQEWASAVDISSTQVTEVRLIPASGAPDAPAISATAVGSVSPSTTLKYNNVGADDLFGDFNKGIGISNEQFIIAPNLVLHYPPDPYSAYASADLPVGNGQNEVTRWSFNFAEAPQYLTFFPLTEQFLQSVRLELTIRAKAGCDTDTVTLGTLNPIKIRDIFPLIANHGCPVDQYVATSVELLNNFYTSADIADALGASPSSPSSLTSLPMEYSANAIVIYARLTLSKNKNINTPIASLVGDKYDLHPGDPVDVPPRSQRMMDFLKYVEARGGQNPNVDLDVGGHDRQVGLTHFFALPDQALVTSAKVKFRIHGNAPLVSNDSIVYNDSVITGPTGALLPVIAYRDLLGSEPQNNQDYEPTLDLGKVPLRTVDAGAGGKWSAYPNEYRDLLPVLMRDGQLDLMHSDDATIDYSELTITFVFPNASNKYDLNGDGAVDLDDVYIITNALNTPAYTKTVGRKDPRDLDGDGLITVADARILTTKCTKTGCKK